MEKTCEVIGKKHKLCGKPAKYKVRHKEHKRTFLVCEGCIGCYRNRAFGQERAFIVEELK